MKERVEHARFGGLPLGVRRVLGLLLPGFPLRRPEGVTYLMESKIEDRIDVLTWGRDRLSDPLIIVGIRAEGKVPGAPYAIPPEPVLGWDRPLCGSGPLNYLRMGCDPFASGHPSLSFRRCRHRGTYALVVSK